MHLDFTREICSGRPLIPLFFSFNAINGDKSSANREKSANNTKRSKSEDKSSANGEKSASNNKKSKSKDKLSAIREKLAGNNKEGKPENELSANQRELTNNNSKDPDIKPSADIENLV